MKFLATREKNLGCSNLVFHVAKSFLTEISQGLLFLLKSPTFFAKVKSDGKITSKANKGSFWNLILVFIPMSEKYRKSPTVILSLYTSASKKCDLGLPLHTSIEFDGWIERHWKSSPYTFYFLFENRAKWKAPSDSSPQYLQHFTLP